MKKEVEEVFVHDQVYDYIVRLAQATRNNDALELGLSPRGSLALLKMAQARAYRKGRSFVIPADVAAEFQDVASATEGSRGTVRSGSRMLPPSKST